MSKYLKTIGLEIHIKLNSDSKMFCQCRNEQNFDTLLPNTNICPVCTGQPGALPTLSKDVLDLSLKLGKALNCKINKESQFDRKSYFYPDLPMGYQITQLYKPTNVDGKVKFFVNNYEEEREINILDAHMESDTAKMIHNEGQALIDFNRAGTPLVEIVTGPDFTNEDEVVEFLKELQRIVRYNDISNADMEKGQMRVDVNISIRKSESEPLGTRVELKNINSFGMIKRAIQHEYQRQVDMIEEGEKFGQQTRMWNDIEGISKLMRSKEDALDYRYFPEPDMPILSLSDEILQRCNDETLTIPHDIIKKFKQEYGFHKEYINALIGDQTTLDYFLDILSSLTPQDCVGKDINVYAKTIAKRIAGPISAYIKEKFVDINNLKFDIKQFKDFLNITNEGKIMENQMKIVMDEMLETGKSAQEIIKEKGFDTPAVDSGELEGIVKKVLDENPSIVEQYKGGKTSTIGFFVGQVMKKTQGKANPKKVKEIVAKVLG
ncbi:MAG TPA: Asp-tRNA(Asn)/Glu-tRNA(Gln) amidotransferase subunit GatB [Candidatus Absconditabacterales bacterium]|nr:Asp-tRNA(Asn)/Glu-tRNA(Gln) amidotransferase subunit GatB [Candidatus Absconditabacterales bacterium]